MHKFYSVRKKWYHLLSAEILSNEMKDSVLIKNIFYSVFDSYLSEISQNLLWNKLIVATINVNKVY